jgi:N-methylhydantoinase A
LTVTVALDIGGTFTDLVFYDSETGTLGHGKSATTPARLIEGIAQTLAKADVSLADVSDFVHGSTIAINTVLERKGAETALIVTKGTRDVYAVGRQNRPDAYDIFFHRPRPLVPRRLTFEIDERVTPRTVITELTDEALAEVVARVKASGVASVAVSLLHSYARPEHEIRVGEALAAELPDLYITLSHDILRSYREYERTSTTVLNAYVGPKVKAYLDDLNGLLVTRGFTGQLFIMQSNGGAMSPDVARRTPVAMMESGPVGGIAAAADFGRQLGLPNVIAFDMGGTTAKASLVTDFQPTISDGYYIGGAVSGQPLMLPVVDVIEVGTGGGSIARIDEVGALQVGPESAGGQPGPICYGWGGTRPTVTDANLVLGRLGAGEFLGGEMPLDVEAAAGGIEQQIAGPLGMSTVDAAHGVVEIAKAAMALAVRAVSVERGYDPRDFALIGFGGAGPLHACAIARDLHIPTVVVPPFPGHYSAVGMLGSSLRHDLVRTVYVGFEQVVWDEVRQIADDLVEAGRKQLADEGVADADMSLDLGLDLRYTGQEFTLTVPVAAAVLQAGDAGRIRADFAEVHQQRYGHAAPTEAVELVNVRVAAVTPRPQPVLRASGKTGAALRGRRPVVFDRGVPPLDTPVYDRELLGIGEEIEGPAIIEEYASTTVLWPGDRLTRGPGGELVIKISGGAR